MGHRRWHLDPAGNRLPDRLGRDAAPGGERQDWASQVRQNLQDPGFDLLQQSGNAPGAVFEQAPGEKGFTPIARYRYDAFGRRLGKTVVRQGQGRE
ncbi:hypothetical protein, partial [Paracidovorax valerianellae]|uniref:hypothetical protein n=1 Tax=Paracidovorax valerianellae TaxID=187868 RepID=UPI002302A509